MTRKIFRKPQAKWDIAEIASYIAQDSINASNRFIEAVEETFVALARRPLMGASRTFKDPELAAVRMWPVKRFDKYLVFYRPLENGIDVLRVIHGARDIEALFRQQVASARSE